MTPETLFVGGTWKEAAQHDPIRSPWDGREVFRAPRASPADVEQAIAAAASATKPMAKMPAFERRDLLRRIAEGLVARRDDLTRSIVAESGKPVTATRGEIDRAVITFGIAAEEATRIDGEWLPLDLEQRGRGWQAFVGRVPIGPVAGITPFNFPVNLVAHKLAPAFAAGCPIIIKPPPQCPGAALILAEICEQAGAPKGALSVLPCGPETASLLVTDPRIRMLSFTGSARVGWELKSKAGRKKVVLELGGNAGVAIDETADLPAAAKSCALAAFAQAGQVCIKVQRIYVVEKVREELTRLFLEEVAKLPVGDPADPKTVIGPLIDEGAAKRVESWIGEAVREGARILAGGSRRGNLLPAHVLTGTKPSQKVVCEEVFGPVAVIEGVPDFGEALARVDASEWGLQAGVFTRDLARAELAWKSLEVGTVVINEAPTFRIDSMPYGGVKGSGFGREGLRYAIEEMTERKGWLLRFPEPRP